LVAAVSSCFRTLGASVVFGIREGLSDWDEGRAPL
jgi:hypothetical protein